MPFSLIKKKKKKKDIHEQFPFVTEENILFILVYKAPRKCDFLIYPHPIMHALCFQLLPDLWTHSISYLILINLRL